ncbi:hypothetical protein T439DRAFT_316647 [Meredithblackwellia eburnea MCA 4105]
MFRFSNRLVLLCLLFGSSFYLLLRSSSVSSSSNTSRFGAPTTDNPGPLVTLASSMNRLNTTLIPTILSLVSQSLPPKRIHVFLPTTDRPHIKQHGLLPLALRHERVRVDYVDDIGPATKLLPLLESIINAAREEGGKADEPILDERIVVLDDDHAYSPQLLETLVNSFEELGGDKVVAMRGWRVRRELEWGVAGDQLWRHVVEGTKIRKPYRVGVVTANEGYLVLPRFFLPPQSTADQKSQTIPQSVPILDYSKAPESAHLVDDIWISHHLSLARVPRYVVPLAPSFPSLDLTDYVPNNHPLEHHMSSHSVSRGDANTQVLLWGRGVWEGEEREILFKGAGSGKETVGPGSEEKMEQSESIWWDERPNGMEPEWNGWWSSVRTEWGRWRLRRWVDRVWLRV